MLQRRFLLSIKLSYLRNQVKPPIHHYANVAFIFHAPRVGVALYFYIAAAFSLERCSRNRLFLYVVGDTRVTNCSAVTNRFLFFDGSWNTAGVETRGLPELDMRGIETFVTIKYRHREYGDFITLCACSVAVGLEERSTIMFTLQ